MSNKKMIKRKSINAWINERFPLTELWQKQVSHYFAPKNFNFWYYFGSFSLLVLLNQIITGIWLTMDYTPTAGEAFSSIQHIMLKNNNGQTKRFSRAYKAGATKAHN